MLWRVLGVLGLLLAAGAAWWWVIRPAWRRDPWQVIAGFGLVCLVAAAWLALGAAGGLAVAGVCLLAVAWDGRS